MWISPLLTKMCKLLVLVLVAVVPLVSMSEELSYDKLEKMENTWANWKKQHGKSYSPREEIYRRMIFFKKLLSIEEHNSKYPVEVSYTKGLNQFSDWTREEYKAYNTLNATDTGYWCDTFLPPLNFELPASVDWRKEGYVTAVKDQGECGSCWAFTTTGSVEGQHARQTGFLISLSEQQLIDCSDNLGCRGGIIDWAYKYIMGQTNGLETEDSYPYTAKDGTCAAFPKLEQAPVTGCVDVTKLKGDELALQQAVASVGPISVAIDAGHDSFRDYNGGVYYNSACSSTYLDHGVLVVGYGTDESSGLDYWLVKNSWGAYWGIDGYIKMARNQDNNCGIATLASYPIVDMPPRSRGQHVSP